MNVKFISAIVATSLLTFSAAHAVTPKPEKCPSVSALQAISFEGFEKDNDDGTWAGGVLGNNYDTNDRWTFVMAKIPASDEVDARAKAIDAMSTLKAAPEPVERNGYWVCFYPNDKSYFSFSITPAFGLRAATKMAV